MFRSLCLWLSLCGALQTHSLPVSTQIIFVMNCLFLFLSFSFFLLNSSFNNFSLISSSSLSSNRLLSRKSPVLGSIPINGVKPIYGKHKGTDAIFALACKYPLSFYLRFVGTLRKFDYKEDIVLAVSPPEQMKPGVENYVIQSNVVAYGFDVDCLDEC